VASQLSSNSAEPRPEYFLAAGATNFGLTKRRSTQAHSGLYCAELAQLRLGSAESARVFKAIICNDPCPATQSVSVGMSCGALPRASAPGRVDCDGAFTEFSTESLHADEAWPAGPARNAKPAAEPASQPMNTENTNGESTPPAITSFSPARSGASSPRKCSPMGSPLTIVPSVLQRSRT
jgi:hypothetical protein